jgi:hypothetical protein
MHRTAAVAGVLTLSALLLPAAISSSAGSSTRANESIAVLERPAGPADSLPPEVARQIDAKEVDLSTTRLAATSGVVQYFVAQGTRGICLIRLDGSNGPAYVATCANTLIAGGVFLASLDRQKGTMQVADVVPDDVTHARVAGSKVGAQNNLVLTGEVPLGASIEVVGSAGPLRVPIAVSASPLPAG